MEIVKELKQRFSDPDETFKEADQKEFAKLLGDHLSVENILQNYDELASLKALQILDTRNFQVVKAFKA